MINKVQKTNISFGYTTILSKLWKQGKLPNVTKGFYGDVLSNDKTKDTYCTNEHLKVHSNGGATTLKNIVLASARKNNERGNKPLIDFFNKSSAEEYLESFKDLVVSYEKNGKIKYFIGNTYIQGIKETTEKLIGLKIDWKV